MGTYRDLLISTGGGIIGTRQMDEQEKCATIAIGLGGTGVSCLKNLKRQVYSRLQPDDPEAAVPAYKHIKFLAVDTDKNSLYDREKEHENTMINSLDEETEFFDLSTSAISALLEETQMIATRPEFTWLSVERFFIKDRDQKKKSDSKNRWMGSMMRVCCDLLHALFSLQTGL